MSSLSCPSCGSNDIKRVKTLVEGELANTPTGHALHAPMKPSLPPQPPNPDSVVRWKPSKLGLFDDLSSIFGMFLISMFICLVIFGGNIGPYICIAFLIVLGFVDGGVIDGLWIAMSYPAEQQEAAQALYDNQLREYRIATLPKWEYTRQKWEQLQRCGQCGKIFLPSENAVVEPDRMNELLHQGWDTPKADVVEKLA